MRAHDNRRPAERIQGLGFRLQCVRYCAQPDNARPTENVPDPMKEERGAREFQRVICAQSRRSPGPRHLAFIEWRFNLGKHACRAGALRARR